MIAILEMAHAEVVPPPEVKAMSARTVGTTSPTISIPSGASDEYGSDVGDFDDLPSLPKDTKVLIIGNSRTKRVLVGLRGVVKKSVGLGGWHWLQLENGDLVKLQRNALHILEAPAGVWDFGDDNDTEFEGALPTSRSDGLSGLPSPPSVRPKSRKSGQSFRTALTPTPNRFSLGFSRYEAMQTLKFAAMDDENWRPEVDLTKLDTACLRRYRRKYGLEDVTHNSSKQDLYVAVRKHFNSMKEILSEDDIIPSFVQAVKRHKRNHVASH
ncbi:hypothetical protein KFL_000310210 [Klebsormidium nitens]|uniref:Histone deacetylase complex subunit SAP30 Sin3 binding domain-containing protein n=1 Tax=Klebsormidium nitens TaxID=105231 RepID=A0A1Y1HLH9_KLENI|nr:hypothetical protein KFL_000310210 [Klebsormidium nitens]|eukprot:GAQ79470.1 hypothetical protein KFL_000310210 [Klebsormidium nitens]